MAEHTVIFTDNHSDKYAFSESLLQGNPPEALSGLRSLSGALFSNARIADFIEE